MTIYEAQNKEGLTKRRTLERAKRVTRRRAATKATGGDGYRRAGPLALTEALLPLRRIDGDGVGCAE